MNYTNNPGKNLQITTAGGIYIRHAIKTHFIQAQEDYIELVQHYVGEWYQPGDVLAISEKVIALCQNRIVTTDGLKISKLARLLVRFAGHSTAGIGVHNPYKMQFAINYCGYTKILTAALAGGLCKLFGYPGVFYRIAGQEVSGLDGFYGKEFKAYENIGIRIPAEPEQVCNEIYKKTGIAAIIVDANDLGVELLGKASVIKQSREDLISIVRDNPAGQSAFCTPFILARKLKAVETLVNSSSGKLEQNYDTDSKKTKKPLYKSQTICHGISKEYLY